MAVLDVHDLQMSYRLRHGAVRAVDGVSFRLDRGVTLGLVGESGSGKTSVAYCLLRLLPRNAHVRGGEILLDGTDLLALPEQQMREYRWNRVSMIFQGAMNAFNPVFRVGDQIVEAIRLHKRASHAQARARVDELFELVGLPSARVDDYPHEFSGGMKQRAMIAMALACDPDVVVADEPTTALDVVVQDQILEKIQELQRRLNLAMLVISHDMAMVAETCDRVAVMYAGQIVETGDTKVVFADPRHPYTIGLVRSFPNLRGPLRHLESMPGDPPSLMSPPPACRFAPRCPIAQPICHAEAPALADVVPGHASRCHFADDLSMLSRVDWADA